MIAIQDIKKDDNLWFEECKCGNQYIFKALEKKQSIEIVCDNCKSKTTLKYLANGKISKKWKSIK